MVCTANERKDVFWQDQGVVAYYLETERQAVPLAEEQLDAMLRVIDAFDCPTRTVLDVGAGDGEAAAFLAHRFPVERVTLVDCSPPMLQQAALRFQGSSLEVDSIDADLGCSSWLDALPPDVPEYDLVVSRYAIHHLPDDRKQALYRELFTGTSPGGVFINIEHVSSESHRYSTIFNDLLIEGMVATSGTGLDLAAAAASYHDRRDGEANILAPADVQCGWLRDTGFVDVDVVLKIFELAVIVARRPA
jgi:SAM-dependent methyltransferase